MKQCNYPNCKTKIVSEPMGFGEVPYWFIKTIEFGFCMKHGLQEFGEEEE
jgi:hypothetical protein